MPLLVRLNSRMARIGELDLPDRLAPYGPAWTTQLLFGLLCAGVAILGRALVDTVAPGAGPFALGFPAMLLATLFARWPAGLLTSIIYILYAWYFILPEPNSFRFATPADGARVIVTVVTYGGMLIIAELFRQSVRRANDERDREIEKRDLFLEEFDHRVKNNFALVASLLELQRRRAVHPATAEALGTALSRVESIARAHRHLYRGAASPDQVEMRAYLSELCSALADALFLHGAITLGCDADDGHMPRDRAVSIGLVLNELVTNAAKHAFAESDAGAIEVRFRKTATGWQLTVRDDGCGMPAGVEKGGGPGLGQRLIDAFARQAGGTLFTESGPDGTTVTLTLAA